MFRMFTGTLMYAWTALEHHDIPWIAPVIGITLFTIGCFHVYLSVFNYLADCEYRLFLSFVSLGTNQILFNSLFDVRQLCSQWSIFPSKCPWGCLPSLHTSGISMLPAPFINHQLTLEVFRCIEI